MQPVNMLDAARQALTDEVLIRAAEAWQDSTGGTTQTQDDAFGAEAMRVVLLDALEPLLTGEEEDAL